MNKLFGYGRTRTRLSLILLSALAVLCIAIVSLCVFNNLNALATDNIAFAEEPDRSPLSATGYVPDNQLPNNYCADWSYSVTNNSSVLSGATQFYSDNSFTYLIYNGSLTNNVLSAGAHLIIRFDAYLSNSLNYTGFLLGCFSSVSTLNVYYYASDDSQLSNFAVNTSVSGAYHWNNKDIVAVKTFNVGNYLDISAGSGITLRYIGLYFQNFTGFSGYVSPDYQYYGYNQGYLDGQSNIPYPEYTNSTGLVGSNQLKYSYWVDADFSVESSGYTTIYEEDNQKIQLLSGNLSGNTLTSTEYRSTRTSLIYRVPKPSGAYTLAVYISGVHGLWNFGVINTEYLIDLEQGLNVIHVPAPSETREAYIQFNILATDSNDEITISWFKLEDGDAFTGYVAPDNTNSYEAGYEQGVIDGYNEGLSDLNNARSYINNSLMNTKGPYYAERISDSVDPNDSDYAIIEVSFFSSISGVTYGSYLPVYFDLNMDFPIGSDLHWIIDGTLSIYTSLSTPEELHTIHYGFYDSLSFITYGPEYVPWQNTISYSANITELIFHANYSGAFLVLWLYTDSSSPYVKFTYRTPIVDGRYSVSPYSFAYNPYSVSATEVVDAARQQGFSEGFNTGYNQGKFENSSSQTYTFKNLIGAVFDAPITALVGKYDEETDARIGGLLNFEILGVNLGGFVIGLLSLAIILFVLRVFMRGL